MNCGKPRQTIEMAFSITISKSSIIALAIIGLLDQSMRIECRGDFIEVAFAAKMSVVTTSSCAVDGPEPTVVLEAVCTLPFGGPSAADRHFVWRAGPGRKALDIAKNLLW